MVFTRGAVMVSELQTSNLAGFEKPDVGEYRASMGSRMPSMQSGIHSQRNWSQPNRCAAGSICKFRR